MQHAASNNGCKEPQAVRSHAVWRAHAPRMHSSVPSPNYLETGQSSRWRGRHRSEPDWRMHAGARALPNRRCLVIITVLLCPTFGAVAQDVTPTPQPAGQPIATTVEVIVT